MFNILAGILAGTIVVVVEILLILSGILFHALSEKGAGS